MMDLRPSRRNPSNSQVPAPSCKIRISGMLARRLTVKCSTLIVFLTALLASAPLVFEANAGQAVSEKKLKVVVGYQPLTPTWGATIVTGAKLWKPYLPNVEVERFDAMSGMPLVNNMLADKINLAYLGDMPTIILASKSGMAQTRFVSLTDADEGGAAVIYVRKGSSF